MMFLFAVLPIHALICVFYILHLFVDSTLAGNLNKVHSSNNTENDDEQNIIHKDQDIERPPLSTEEVEMVYNNKEKVADRLAELIDMTTGINPNYIHKLAALSLLPDFHCDTDTSHQKLIYSSPFVVAQSNNLINKKDEIRMTVSILERICRFKAELQFISPEFSLNTLGNNLPSPTSSTTTACSSKRNSVFSTPSYDTEATLYDQNFKYSAITPKVATIQDISRISSNFSKIQTKIQIFMSKKVDGFSSFHAKQLDEAFQSLVDYCNDKQDQVKKMETTYVFDKMANYVNKSIKETENYMQTLLSLDTLVTPCHIEHLHHLAVHSIHCAHTIKKVFKDSNNRYLFEISALISSATTAYDNFSMIRTVHEQVSYINSLIQDGMVILDNTILSDKILLNNYDESLQLVQGVQVNIYGAIMLEYGNLMARVMEKIEHQLWDTASAICEKLEFKLIKTIAQPLQQFKYDMMCSITLLKKYKHKQQFKINVDSQMNWLKLFKGKVIASALTDSLWTASSSSIRQDELIKLTNEYSEYILQDYDKICDYFAAYSPNQMLSQYYAKKNNDLNYQQLGDYNDLHLVEEYTWFSDFNGQCQEINEILRFSAQIQSQQQSIVNFLQAIQVHKTSNTQKNTAEFIQRDLFNQISWPIYTKQKELHHHFYNYSRNLYLELSDIKIDFINHCLNH